MSEFTPRQLDAIEDALEDLERNGVPSELREGDEAQQVAAARLQEYRDVLWMARDALQPQEVPEGLLDAVLAEAREVESVPAPEPARETEERPWWQRLRLSVLVPALAVAGGAALVLIIVQPMAGEAPQTESVAAVEDAHEAVPPPAEAAAGEDRLADASLRAQAEPAGEAERGQGLLEEAVEEEIPYRQQAPGAAPPPERDEAEDAWDGEDKRIKSKKQGPARRARSNSASKSESKRSSSTKSGAGAGAADPLDPAPPSKSRPTTDPDPEPEPNAPAPAQEPTDDAPKGAEQEKKDVADPWLLIDEGDKLRRTGQCTMAKKKYTQAKLSANKNVRARALAGLGLCEQRAGDLSGAQRLYDQAQALDASITGFIEQER